MFIRTVTEFKQYLPGNHLSNIETVAMLMEKGANVNARDNYGWMALIRQVSMETQKS